MVWVWIYQFQKPAVIRSEGTFGEVFPEGQNLIIRCDLTLCTRFVKSFWGVPPGKNYFQLSGSDHWRKNHERPLRCGVVLWTKLPSSQRDSLGVSLSHTGSGYHFTFPSMVTLMRCREEGRWVLSGAVWCKEVDAVPYCHGRQARRRPTDPWSLEGVIIYWEVVRNVGRGSSINGESRKAKKIRLGN